MAMPETNASSESIDRCPVCSGQLTPLFDGIDPDHPDQTVPICSCSGCGLGVSRPAVFPDQAQLYPEGYYGTAESANLLNRAALSVFCLERRIRSGVFSHGGSILDFGCGDGTFLGSIVPAWKKFGFETSTEGRKISSDRGIQLIEFEESSIARHENSFDRITMWQVLEHIPDPGPVLDKLNRLLKPDGKLIVSVPNFDGWQSRVAGGSWFHLDPVRHVRHYTKRSLLDLLQQHGFNAEAISYWSFEYGIFGWWQSLLNVLGFEFNSVYKKLKGRFTDPVSAARGPSKAAMLAGLILLPAAAVLSIAESLVARGGVITIRARRSG